MISKILKFKHKKQKSKLTNIVIGSGLACCAAATGIAGYAIFGALGAAFGIMIGYTFGRLVLI